MLSRHFEGKYPFSTSKNINISTSDAQAKGKEKKLVEIICSDCFWYLIQARNVETSLKEPKNK